MGQSGRSRHQKRARAQAQLRNLEAYAAQPHSFVFARGRAGRGVRQLSLDLRRVMEPLTATRLQVRKKNSLKDCVAVAGPLGVTHFLILSKTETNIYFKLMRLPGGPTLTFRINKYTLVRDVVSSLRRHRMHEQQFTHAPLLVLNSFGPHGMHVKLMATMFQNLFPSINVHKVNLNTIKRCLLINYNPDSQELDFRHYSIKVVPVGASRGMKKLLQEKFPNMSRLQDISELLATGAGLSESEAEPDGEHNITELPQAVAGRGNMRAQQSAVRLTEVRPGGRGGFLWQPPLQGRTHSCPVSLQIGPRMTLQLIKIQEGVGEGNVLFHSFGEDGAGGHPAWALRPVKVARKVWCTHLGLGEDLGVHLFLLSAQDRGGATGHPGSQGGEAAAQGPAAGSAGPERPAQAGTARGPQKSLAGIKRSRADGDSDAEDPGAPPEEEGAGQREEEEEDEAEYFRQAVGEEPDEDMFPTAAKRRRPAGHPGKKQQGKQRRLDRGSDRRQLKAKGRAQVAQAKLGPGGATRTHGRGRAQPPKRAA
uniref:Peter pan homolog n=1 Tax=Equus caballus TaxID=9796 RepID=A0A9L0S1W4_HORSE